MRTFFLSLLILSPLVTFGQDYQPLVGIPQLQGQDGFNGYINAVYAMFISIAALLAVVKIIVAGVKYMFSDIATQKSDAKKDIRGALLGLVIVLAAVLILTIINPNLTNFDAGSIRQLDETVAVPNVTTAQLSAITTTEQGRSWIPNDSSGALRLAFSQRCVTEPNPGVLQTSVTNNRLTCNRADSSVLDDVQNDLTDTDTPIDPGTAATTLRQYQTNVIPFLVDDQAEVSSISASLGIDSEAVLFIVTTPPGGLPNAQNGYPLNFETNLRTVCGAYATSQNNPNIDLDYDIQTGFATCADAT